MMRPSLTSLGTTDRRYTLALHRLFERIDDPTQPGVELSELWVLNIRESAVSQLGE
jgi:hypothetical protein